MAGFQCTPRFLVQLGESELRGPIDGDEEVEPALCGAYFGDVDVEVTDRVGLELALYAFAVRPGGDSIGVEPLITGVDFQALIADKAFDSNALRAVLNERARRPFLMTSRCTSGDTWSKTSSSGSKNSVASPLDTTKPTPALLPQSISPLPCSPSDECIQTLVQLLM